MLDVERRDCPNCSSSSELLGVDYSSYYGFKVALTLDAVASEERKERRSAYDEENA